MLRAFSLAIQQLFSPRILGVLGLCTMLAVVVFAGLWFGLDLVLGHWFGAQHTSGSAPGLFEWLGSFLATAVLAWFLFPVVVSAFVALFLEHIAKVVEKEHYPHLPPAPGLPVIATVRVAARFLIVLVVANLLLLLLLLFPLAYAVGWFVVNGWLFGREYFELVAMRRLSPTDADFLRKRHGTECLAIGAVLAAIALVPIANIALPILATTVMVHRFHDWHGRARDHLLGG